MDSASSLHELQLEISDFTSPGIMKTGERFNRHEGFQDKCRG